MKLVTTTDLQRDYALPFATAEIILREQQAVARRHYRIWFALGGIGVALALVGAFVIDRPIANFAFDFVLPFAYLCTGIGELLAQRRAQPAIHAAARAARAQLG